VYRQKFIKHKYSSITMAVQKIEIHVPEYHLNTKPYYFKVGRKVDTEIEKICQMVNMFTEQ